MPTQSEVKVELVQPQSNVRIEFVCNPNLRLRQNWYVAPTRGQGGPYMQPQSEIKVKYVCSLNMRSRWNLYATSI